MSTPSRNHPCPCGSGKKYKNCCANRPTSGAPNPLAGGTIEPLSILQLAIQHHQACRLREAKALYQQVLQAKPNHPDILHFLGVVNHQLGDNDLAYTLISQAIKQVPTAAHFINNLGEVCRALNRLDEAQACYEKAMVLQPAFAEAHRNLGLVYLATGHSERSVSHLRTGIERFPAYLGNYWALGLALSSQGQIDAAIAHYDMALALSPSDHVLLCAKGNALKTKGEFDKAIQHYQHAITLQPTLVEPYHNLGLIYQSLDMRPEAESCFKKVLELQPDNSLAKHLLAALQNITTNRAPASYVKETFDHYADNFDVDLVNRLDYHIPEILAQTIKNAITLSKHTLNILDLGCGTGLFGVQVADIAKSIVGIDLSPKMIDKAKLRQIYNQLIVGDLLDSLADTEPGQFDLIAATDVFIYVGNLTPVFKESARILPPGGWLAFSIESTGTQNDDGYVLDSTGRYQHNPAYIKTLSAQYNFDEYHASQADIRKEKGKPVAGYLYLLKKNDST